MSTESRPVLLPPPAGLALRAAREGIVLLSHKAPAKGGAFALPLAAKSLLLAGPNANNSANMQGIDCHGVPPYLINPGARLHSMDYNPTRWPESPRIVMRCATRPSNGLNHLGL